MTQRIFEYKDKEVMAGWDRPLQRLFYTIFNTDPEQEEVFYDYNDNHPEAKKAMFDKTAPINRDLDTMIQDMVTNQGLILPPGFAEDLRKDMENNEGNLQQRYERTA